MSTRRLWMFLAVGLPVLGALVANLSTVDLAYHLRAGASILDGSGIPSTDVFTFTAAGLPWQDQQWLAQVVLAAVYRVVGWSGLVVLRAALIGTTFGLVVVVVRRLGVPTRRAALLGLVAFVLASPALALRPQLIGMALFGAALALISERHSHPRLVWLLPVVTLVWANIHGSFFLGPAAAGVAWLDDVVARRPDAKRTFVLALVAGVSTLVTPFGPWVYAYALGLSTNPDVTQRIAEWQPTSPRTIPGLAFFVSALGVAVLLARRGRDVPWPTLAWLAVLFLIGAYAIRGIAWWPIGMVVAVAPLLRGDERLLLAERPPMRRANAIIATALAGIALVLLPIWRPSDPLMGPAAVVGDAPAGLTRALLANTRPGDRIFNPQPWGSWFELVIPQATVFVDSRIELFPGSVWDEHEAIVRGDPGWESTLDRYAVTTVVVSDDETSGFVGRLAASGRWRQVYRDSDGTIFVRS